MKQVRPEPEYFRVGFYGKGFPSSVRVRRPPKKIIWGIILYFYIRREGRSDIVCIVRDTAGTWQVFLTWFWCSVFGWNNENLSID